MGAFELSASVKDDVEVPETYGDAKALLANIREMISYISLEKERVEQGIEDMEAIKNNFENQIVLKLVRTIHHFINVIRHPLFDKFFLYIRNSKSHHLYHFSV